MNNLINGILIALIPSIIVSIITANLTVKLSLKQFYSQKWWEKKADTYSNIIESLSNMQYCLGEWFDDGVGIKVIDKEDEGGLINAFKKAREHLVKTAAIGAYIISDDVAKELKILIRELDKKDPSGNYVCDFDNHYGVVGICIEKIRFYAKKELKGK